MDSKPAYIPSDHRIYYGTTLSAFAIVSQLAGQSNLDATQEAAMALFAISIPSSYLSARIREIIDAHERNPTIQHLLLFATALLSFSGGISCIFFHFSKSIGICFVVCLFFSMAIGTKFNVEEE